MKVSGALVFGEVKVMVALVASGGILSFGYIIFGIAMLKTGSYPKIPVWFLIIGAPIFGLGMVLLVRTLGIALFMTGTIWLGNFIRK